MRLNGITTNALDVNACKQALQEFATAVQDEGWLIELGRVLTCELGHIQAHEDTEGDETSVTYDFARYNTDERCVIGTVHYHPEVDTGDNYLPSAEDIWCSAEYAAGMGLDWFVCGVVNHQGRMTLSLVSSSLYKHDDAEWKELVDHVNNPESRSELLATQLRLIEFLQARGLLQIQEI